MFAEDADILRMIIHPRLVQLQQFDFWVGMDLHCSLEGHTLCV